MKMRLWIDLANSPHVPFFKALVSRFAAQGHEIETTARELAETIPLARAAGFTPEVVGAHAGRDVSKKAGSLISRAWALATWARKRKFDLAISHNSYSQILAARGLGLKTITLMDYEHQPANHLAFRFASRIIVPQAFPDAALSRFGAAAAKIRKYDGLKEDVYLADFEPDPKFFSQLERLGIDRDDALVTLRPPASEALYHRFENE